MRPLRSRPAGATRSDVGSGLIGIRAVCVKDSSLSSRYRGSRFNLTPSDAPSTLPAPMVRANPTFKSLFVFIARARLR